MKIVVTQDGSTLVRDRLDMLKDNAWQGMLLVFLTLWAFFNLRLSFWVAMSLPVSLLGAFYFMPILGMSINMLTMVALLLALGLLMDDGIVIAENIASHRAQGKAAMEAAIDGVREVWVGVLSSFLTTVCVLGPLVTIAGDIGKVLRVVPIVLIIVMAVSLVEAFMILPAHLGHSLHNVGSRSGRLRSGLDRFFDWLREDVCGRAIDRLLVWRYAWLGIVVGVFIVSIGMLTSEAVKFQAFPDLDGDVLSAYVLLPSGTPLSRTKGVVSRITEALKRIDEDYLPRQPNGQQLVQSYSVQFNQNMDAFESGPHVATVNVDLLTAEIREGRIDDIVADWRKEIGDIEEIVNLSINEPAYGPAGRPIEIRLQAESLNDLAAAAAELKQWLRRFLGAQNLAEDLRQGKPERRIRLREGTLGLGLDASAMADQLRAAFNGLIVDEIQVGADSYEIDGRLDVSGQDTLADLEQFRFKLPDGHYIPLRAVASIDESRGWARIARVGGIRTVTVRGDLDSRLTKATTLVKEVESQFLPKLIDKYPGLSVSFEGEVKEGSTTSQSMLQAMLLGVYALLSFQFRSYLEPLIVMIAIPMALIGVIWGHWLVGVDMSMPSMLGFVSLAGIVVNDSILLVVFLKDKTAQGEAVESAAAQASRLRFRAIVLTSLTTIAGLMPLMFERSLQAQFIKPLVVSILFGMMASTVLVLLVIPCLYVILADIKRLRSSPSATTKS